MLCAARYLEHEILPKYPQARIRMIRPTMTVLLMIEKTNIARIQLPDFKGVTHIFLPISDVRDVSKPRAARTGRCCLCPPSMPCRSTMTRWA